MGTRTTTIATTITEYVARGINQAGQVDEFTCPFLFEHPSFTAEQIFEAYKSCRKNKSNTKQAIEFEVDLENNLMKLLDEINSGTYEVGPSTVFVIDRPVKREVFAASFRDRVVHHLVVNEIGPCIERRLINDCYACRVGKGTHYGIERLSHFMKSESQNYSREAWILKMDIRGFFMSIDRRLLFDLLIDHLKWNYHKPQLPLVVSLCKKIVFNDPTKGCRFRCSKDKWKGLPGNKSLFTSKRGCGLPIGNLTSQIFANFYMSFLDHYVKHDLGIRCYGRYVDDFFLVHEDKEYLLYCRDRIASFLSKFLKLEINDRKTYLQPVAHGVRFLGVSIKPGHVNMSKRVVGNFESAVAKYNHMNNQRRLDHKQMKTFRSSINSYLGICSHYNTFILRKKIMSRIDPRLQKRVLVSSGFSKISLH